AVSRTIRSLEEHEYLLRENDKNDRRNTFVKLTPKGNDILKQAHVQMSNFLNQMVHDLSKEDKEHLIHCMQQMYSNATAEIERMEHEKRNEKPQKIEIK
ncbi:MAG: winged helix DNA-binding protein, partial [Lachnospiraceae bacterium]|nr:winged helix DNA-binding protein [Lachnospiraceae bacterium]